MISKQAQSIAADGLKICRELSKLTQAIEAELETLRYIGELIKHCPDIQFSFNEDPDIEDEDGEAPIGYTIRIRGCQGVVKATGPTLVEAIRIFIAREFRAALLDSLPSQE